MVLVITGLKPDLWPSRTLKMAKQRFLCPNCWSQGPDAVQNLVRI